MNPECIQPTISRQLLKQFIFTSFDEVGVEKLGRVISNAGLSPAVVGTSNLDHLEGFSAAKVYAHLQQALRNFYGRRARSILMRIGRNI